MESTAAEPGTATADLTLPPAPAPLTRSTGRQEARRRGATTLAFVALPLAVIVVAALVITWLIGSAGQAPRAADTAPVLADVQAAVTGNAGPTSRSPGPGGFGNLVVNWSFERDLSGWQVLGAADASREPQGRTSGSCGLVRARGPQPGRVGLALPKVVAPVQRGERYVASAWVRSSAPGQQVVLRLVGIGGKQSARATATTLPGLAWRRVTVDHTATARTDLSLEITGDEVPAGDALLIDEVVVRRG
jgi:Carbohydrate binding domain